MQAEEIKAQRKLQLIAKYGEDYAQALWGSKGNRGQSARAYEQFISRSDVVEPLFT